MKTRFGSIKIINNEECIMNNGKKEKKWLWVVEVGKWGLVVWLLSPLFTAMEKPVGFWRIVLGVLLFIVSVGKLFYDVVIMDMLQRRRESTLADIITMVGIVLVLLVVIGVVVFFAGTYVMKAGQQGRMTG